MRPLDLTSISAYPGRLRDQLLFYNTELATVRCMRKLTVRNGAHCIKAKSGLSFPPELWVMILNQAEAMALQDPKFSFVKIQFIATMGNIADAGASSDTGKGDTNVVQCAAHKLDLTYEQFLVPDFYNEGELLAGSLLDPAICEDLERFLRCATAEIAARINAQEPPDQTFDVALGPGSNSDTSALYYDLVVPDIMSWADIGCYWVRGGGRLLYPGGRCPGVARHQWYFKTVGTDIRLC
ncbi:hypothetical protein QBC36DRAFT_192744 [Triangularia setosa]|uniref:Uncharacterized protein n=1 Tax=Triangularia setosa TaxID=2587417 RepID=A0AAN6W4N5_9PEZI|nr:hypothetical protein QBC36DRAFT_192744 [Podospora setosa]